MTSSVTGKYFLYPSSSFLPYFCCSLEGVFGGAATDFKFNKIAIVPTDKEPEVSNKLEDANANRMGLCGRLVHFDDSGNPLWSNGGYLTKEEDWPNSSPIGGYPLNPMWYVDGGDWRTEEFIPPIVAGPLDSIWAWFAPKPLLEETYAHWQRIKDKLPMNQYWRIDHNIGVNCIMANSRGIQKVPMESYTVASKAVERFFLLELDKEVKYENYF